jgi:ATP-dependent helicase/nuclease subunit A
MVRARGALAVKPTPEQRLAIDTPGARVAVAAGAGSGKTTMLVQAIWEDLDVHGVAPEDLLAASYNRSAAAHLAARLQRKVAAERGPARAALDLSAGWVGTLHALCARVVREQPFAARVDPGFVEIDEAEAAALFDAALDEALETTDDPGFAELLTHATGAGPVREAIRQAHARLRTAGMERPRLGLPDPQPDLAPLVGRLETAARALAESRLARDDHRAEAAAARRMIAAPDERPSRAPKGSKNCAHALRPLVEEFNEAAEDLFAARWAGWADAQLAGFAVALAATADAYEARKRRAGALDFEDLELAARRVLRAGLGPRLSRVYVDEFQDANPLQDELVTLLGAERTMVVGDASQAVYGFRHSDPTRFLERVRADAAV